MPQLCPECGKAMTQAATFLGKERLTCLPCNDKRKEEAEAAAAAFAKDQQRDEERKQRRMLASSGIEPRFMETAFDDFKPPTTKARDVLAFCRDYAANFDPSTSGSILMLGGCGTGKNMLSSIIGQEIISAGYTSLHTTAMKLVRRIKESWARDSGETEQGAINSFVTPDLLVVDEIGVQFGSATEQLFINEVINERYGLKRPTILISNLNLKQIEEVIGVRAVDRFFEKPSRMLVFDWPSYRRKKD